LTADLRLIPLGDERTRLITRLHTVYEWRRALALGTVLLMELADYPMMRRMLRGIPERVEAKQATGPERSAGLGASGRGAVAGVDSRTL
jgi:hypothetical protein